MLTYALTSFEGRSNPSLTSEAKKNLYTRVIVAPKEKRILYECVLLTKKFLLYGNNFCFAKIFRRVFSRFRRHNSKRFSATV